MSASPFFFYGMALGLLVFSILSTSLPQVKFARGCLILAFCLGIGMLYSVNVSFISLAIFILLTILLFALAAPRLSLERQAIFENPKSRLLTWIILGSFLLVIAVVLRGASWPPGARENLPDWKEIMSQYGILVILLGGATITFFLWHKTIRND